MSLTTLHPGSGESLSIENPNPLTAEHIKVGGLLWGLTSTDGWDCPAIITWVDKKLRQFRVRSLNDMCERDQLYSFGCTPRSPTSRQTMQVATIEEVRTYLDGRRVRLVENVEQARSQVTRVEADLARFDALVSTIIPTT